jgi:hypothetical protein
VSTGSAIAAVETSQARFPQGNGTFAAAVLRGDPVKTTRERLD